MSVILWNTPSLYAQKMSPSLHISSTENEIKIDGELKEEAWNNCAVADQFYQSVPVDTAYAKSITEVMMTYDEKYLYIAAICYDTLKEPFIIQSLKRDFSYPVSDAFAIYIDPYNDLTNGFSFAVNPKGVQREGLIQVGGNYGVTTAWDILWYSEVKVYPDRWIVEMAIPFSSLRFKPGEKKWRVNFSRNNLKINEGSSWAAVPRNFNIASLPFCGELIWDKPLTKRKKSAALIPYVTGGVQQKFQVSEEINTFTQGVGGDARISVTNSLQLDLTINPDFSQVEVDRQVTNLSRFNLYFPERRNFFIENSDLFSDFGFRQIRPFFSRKIGLQNGSIVPILGGARLSGKLNKDWRIGMMNIQTDQSNDILQQNYTVAALQRRILKNSTIGIIGLNRNSFSSSKFNTTDYNRIIGTDFNFGTLDRKWTGKAFYHHSFSPTTTTQNFTHASWLAYSSPSVFIMWNHEFVGQNYTADFGFVPRIERYDPDIQAVRRQSYWRLEPMIAYTFYPKKKSWFISQRIETYLDRYTDGNYQLTDNQFRNTYKLKLNNTSSFRFDVNDRFTKLYFNTDLTFTNDTNAYTPRGNYSYRNVQLSYESNVRKPLSWETSYMIGDYYNGKRTSINATLNYRWQPIGKFSIYVNQNTFDMPSLTEDKALLLVGSNIELAFTKSIFFSTFFQYNTQITNFNINSRLQWRFKPMSDLYIVYTDNYLTTDFTAKNRGLVIKLQYWIQ